MHKKYFIALFSTFILYACEKEEIPVPKHDPGHVITNSVNMNSDYKWQIYFDLKTNTVVGQNLKSIWDLGFACSETENHIILNSAKSMFCYNTLNSNFNTVTDTSGFSSDKKCDHPSGHPDSTAIGEWEGFNNVYIIDRGYNENGIHQGYKKIQFLNATSTSYTIRFADLNGNNDTTIQVAKDTNYNFTFLSFTNASSVIVEPPKNTWDLVFSQYTHIFYEPEPTPYLVTGCLLNRHQTMATIDSTTSFNTINFTLLTSYSLSSNINTIGYNWKTYSGSTYITHPYYNYIIKDQEGYYYKLHFIDFYNASGIKGNPKWEFQQL
ncbi:MAG: hypothetical protein J0L87_03430 [Bacteroidetes bacterium]|nr:hypothetical protein [Bacteroidota bacterium]